MLVLHNYNIQLILHTQNPTHSDLCKEHTIISDKTPEILVDVTPPPLFQKILDAHILHYSDGILIFI